MLVGALAHMTQAEKKAFLTLKTKHKNKNAGKKQSYFYVCKKVLKIFCLEAFSLTAQ